MSSRTVKRLTDLEIDEVSLVDRPANQHGLVAFAKRHGEDSMTIYDANGVEVFEDELEVGDVVFDDNGNELEFVAVEDGTSAELGSGHDYEDDEEPVLVGKRSEDSGGRRAAASAFPGYHGAIAGRKGRKLRAAGNEWGGAVVGGAPGQALMARGASRGSVKQMAAGYGLTLGGAIGGSQLGHRRNVNRGHLKNLSKSLGASVYEELSKALTADDQMQVVAKMADEVEIYKSQAEYAMSAVEALQDERELEEFTEIAKGYGLPTDPYVLGSILKSAAETLDDTQLAELDRLLTSQGELYDELGSDLGLNDSEVMGFVQAQALELVGKADGLSEPEAIVAMFEANPAAYDEYLAESR